MKRFDAIFLLMFFLFQVHVCSSSVFHSIQLSAGKTDVVVHLASLGIGVRPKLCAKSPMTALVTTFACPESDSVCPDGLGCRTAASELIGWPHLISSVFLPCDNVPTISIVSGLDAVVQTITTDLTVMFSATLGMTARAMLRARTTESQSAWMGGQVCLTAGSETGPTHWTLTLNVP